MKQKLSILSYFSFRLKKKKKKISVLSDVLSAARCSQWFLGASCFSSTTKQELKVHLSFIYSFTNKNRFKHTEDWHDKLYSKYKTVLRVLTDSVLGSSVSSWQLELDVLYWSNWRLARRPLRLVYGIVEAFSVASDLDGEELDPSGWRQQQRTSDLCLWCGRFVLWDSGTHQIWCSPPCSPSGSPDAAECHSWSPPPDPQTGYRTVATSAVHKHVAH